MSRITLGAWALCLLARAPIAACHVRGTTGRAQRGCGASGSCHGPGAGATATLMGPLVVAPGSRTTYTLSINSALAGFVAGGCDVSAVGATLATNPSQASTQLVASELVHAAAIARPAGAALVVRFDVIAPAAPGVIALSAAGNAVNLDRLDTGDAWAIAPLRVTVGDPQSDAGAPPADAEVPSDAAPDADPFGGDAALAFDPSRSLAYGRCSAAPSAGGGSCAPLGLLAMAFAARRRRSR